MNVQKFLALVDIFLLYVQFFSDWIVKLYVGKLSAKWTLVLHYSMFELPQEL